MKKRSIVTYINKWDTNNGLYESLQGAKVYISRVSCFFVGSNLDDFNEQQAVLKGALALRVQSKRSRKFESHFRRVTPNNSPNPWLKGMWRETFNCTWNKNFTSNHITRIDDKDKPDCAQFKSLFEVSGFKAETNVGIIMDSVRVFAHALDHLTKGPCEGLHNAALRDCVRSSDLLAELKKVQFSGYTGNVSFDIDGDVLSGYELINYVGAGDYRSVGIYDTMENKWYIRENDIVWPDLTNVKTHR